VSTMAQEILDGKKPPRETKERLKPTPDGTLSAPPRKLGMEGGASTPPAPPQSAPVSTVTEETPS
jgi:hypothetical protein